MKKYKRNQEVKKVAQILKDAYVYEVEEQTYDGRCYYDDWDYLPDCSCDRCLPVRMLEMKIRLTIKHRHSNRLENKIIIPNFILT